MSIGQVHALSYPEYHSWELFYLIEPWGWQNEEVNISRIIAMQHNSHAKKAKAAEEFMRDTAGEILKQLQEEPDVAEISREDLIKIIKKDFGV